MSKGLVKRTVCCRILGDAWMDDSGSGYSQRGRLLRHRSYVHRYKLFQWRHISLEDYGIGSLGNLSFALENRRCSNLALLEINISKDSKSVNKALSDELGAGDEVILELERFESFRIPEA